MTTRKMREAATFSEDMRLHDDLDQGAPLSDAYLTALATLGRLSTRLSAIRPHALTALRRMPMPPVAQMDPRLQLALTNQRMGKRGVMIASAGSDEVLVVARVSDLAAWQQLPDVLPCADLGEAADGSRVVTGRIPIKRIEALRREPIVKSLKASQPVMPALAATLHCLGTLPYRLPEAVKPLGGQGVVIGIVDMGGDFAHYNFRRTDGSTRLLALWHQAGIPRLGSPLRYGRLFKPEEINAALGTADPYATLGYDPRPDPHIPSHGAHGTHVMDIAGGNGAGTGQPGVAPEADLVFVDVDVSDIPWQGPNAARYFFGDSVQMLEAVRFVFDQAGDRPCVVNLSLGTFGGPHDGSSLVEQGLDAMVRERPGRAVVIAAGNSQSTGIHVAGTVPVQADHDVAWIVRAGFEAEFELWYDGASRLEVTLIGPDGTVVALAVQPGGTQSIGVDDDVAVFISSRLLDPNNRDNVIAIWLAAGVPGGGWTVRLRSLNGRPVPFHAWVERADGGQSHFAHPVATHTLGSISTGSESIVVGAFDGHKPSCPVAYFSSAGPTRDGREKPEVSAPGQHVVAACSGTLSGVMRESGTSMASPAVAGLIALMLAEASRHSTMLSITDIRRKLLGGAIPHPAMSSAWDAQFGAGLAHSRSI